MIALHADGQVWLGRPTYTSTAFPLISRTQIPNWTFEQ